MSPELLDQLLRTAFNGPVPALLDRLINREQAARVLVDRYVLAPILPFDEAPPARFYVSDELDPPRWEQAIRETWPEHELAAFLALAPKGTRRMIDADGAGKAIVYLDDLQVVDHGLPPAAAGKLMCECLLLPSNIHERMSLHRDSPKPFLPDLLSAQYERLMELKAPGFWGLRWKDGEVVSLTWITESRWHGHTKRTNAILAQLGPRKAWFELLKMLESAGLIGYPDAVEFGVEGHAEVHLGICSPQRELG